MFFYFISTSQLSRNPAINFPGVSRSLFGPNGELTPVCLEHNPKILSPVITGTWMPESVGSLAGRSLIFAETQV